MNSLTKFVKKYCGQLQTNIRNGMGFFFKRKPQVIWLRITFQARKNGITE